jgi:hypothetical protein
MTTLATRAFWIDAGERAAKTAAQAAIGAFSQAAVGIDLFTIDFVTVVGVAGGGALLSLLTSVASVKRTGTASAV